MPELLTHPGLVSVLEEARTLGFLGPGPVQAHIEHAGRFLRAAEAAPKTALDLGSGGGVPGLVLALLWPESTWVLADAAERRVSFLRSAIGRLNLSERVSAVSGRAEDLGRDNAFREQFDLVTARAFGPPAVTAECAAPFLKVEALLIVSDPPDAADRWPDSGLAALGLARRSVEEPHVAVLVKTAPLDGRFPRRVGVPAKRPLF